MDRLCGLVARVPGSGFDSRHYQVFWDVVGLERSQLSLVRTTEELLERKNSGSGLESREYGLRGPSRRPRGSLYLQKFPLTSPTSGSRSVGIARSMTKATEFKFKCGYVECVHLFITSQIRFRIVLQTFEWNRNKKTFSCDWRHVYRNCSN
jgi:hypothetical protein